jgi:hypothetical protein
MIPKGNQRAGGRQLATHLMNQYDNERVELAEIRGAVAPDLHGAFAEWRAEANATRCKQYLYSLSLNPDHRQGPFTREHYYDFIERTEKGLGLAEQPRAVIFHVKQGREHCHVVWSRIDLDKMKAVQLSHDRQKLRTVAQEFARDHGIELPKAMQKNRGKDRYKDRSRWENLAERQQYERTGITKEQRMRDVRAAWDRSDNATSLVRALEERGYLLARGDRRGYVVVDRGGDIHSLSRQLAGITTKDIKERLKEYPTERLPDAHTAQKFIRENLQRQPEKQRPGPTPEERRAGLAAEHAKRREPLNRLRAETKKRQQQEREALLVAQRARDAGIADERLRKQPKGLLAFVARITGMKAVTEWKQRRQDQDRQAEHLRQQEALDRRHKRERHEIKRRYRAISLVEARERRSLETRLRREGYREPVPEKDRDARDRDQTDGGRSEDTGRAGRGGSGGGPRPAPGVLAPPAQEPRPGIRGRLSRLFRRQTEQTKQEAKENAGDLTRPPQRADTADLLRDNATDITRPSQEPAAIDPALAEALKARAARMERQRQKDESKETPRRNVAPEFNERATDQAKIKPPDRHQRSRPEERTIGPDPLIEMLRARAAQRERLAHRAAEQESTRAASLDKPDPRNPAPAPAPKPKPPTQRDSAAAFNRAQRQEQLAADRSRALLKEQLAAIRAAHDAEWKALDEQHREEDAALGPEANTPPREQEKKEQRQVLAQLHRREFQNLRQADRDRRAVKTPEPTGRTPPSTNRPTIDPDALDEALKERADRKARKREIDASRNRRRNDPGRDRSR